jgi:chemotaxis protein CheD
MTRPPAGEATHGLDPIEVFLAPGSLHCVAAPSRVTTILGSCVAVCLWDTRLRLCGMNHYLLPHHGGAEPSLRFGDTAIGRLLEAMARLGCQPGALQAKLFGGAAVLGLATGRDPVGDQNVRVALDMLRQCGIPLIARETGGVSGIRIRLSTESGDVMVWRVATPAGDPVAACEPAALTQRW